MQFNVSEGLLYHHFHSFNIFNNNAGQLPGMPQTLPTVFPGFPFAGTQVEDESNKNLIMLI